MITDTDTEAKNISYKDILDNIGLHLKERQGLIAKRASFVSLPLILTVVPMIFFGELTKSMGMSAGATGFIFFILLFLVLFVGLPWAIIMGQIFKIERIIWIDSFFDKVQLTSKESWKLAKKLFWPSVLVNILVFIRYALPAIILSIGSITFYIMLSTQKVITFNWLVFMAILIGILVALIAYVFFINIHLRYLLFLLVDNYKSKEFSYRSLFKEMHSLNRTTKNSEFTKMLVTLLGMEAAESASNVVIGALSGGATSQMGGVGRAAGQATAMYASEVVATNKKYAQAVTFYIYYRVARELTYGKSQTINHKLYAEVVSTDALSEQQREQIK